MLRLCFAVLPALVAGAGYAQETIPDPPKLDFKSHYLVDFASEHVLAASAADERVEPASLTKLMTAYVVFAALAEGRIRLEDRAAVSERAWRMDGTRMFIEVDTEVPVEDLMRGMLIQSGNDASVALAEHVAGSEEAFVALMNEQAAALGMQSTVFRNTTGLPARNHYSTARDMATLAKAMIATFPEYYGLYAEREFSYNGIKQHNRNALLWRDPSVDGLKTGHTAAAGYCLVSSAERDGMRLIAVIMGARSAEARTDGAQALFDYGFETFETHKLYAAGERLSVARVWGGYPEVTALGLARDLFVTIPRGRYQALSASMNLPSELTAPLLPGTPVGEVKVLLAGSLLSNMPLVALEQVAEGGMWARLRDGLSHWRE
jgi:D-alanyl-D-alanine carboxypeptidase (penicillin-binding protein 5/6)